MNGCEFVIPADIDAAAVAGFLAGRQSHRHPVRPPPGAAFSPGRVAGRVAVLLGISATAVSSAIRRHGLTATGNGKTRRLPRAAVETLTRLAARGWGAGDG